MRRSGWGALLLTLVAGPAARAHVVSLSSSEIEVTGRTATYLLRMPAYEIAHVANPSTALLDQIHFAGARRTASECTRDEDYYVCTAAFEFEAEVRNELEVECTLFRVTVPHHIHMLYAVQGENSDQIVLDQSAPRKEVRFHPVTFTDTVARDGGAGAWRLLTSPSGVLFLAALVLAFRTPRGAALLGGLFLAAEWLVRLFVPFLQIGLSPDFLEAFLALTAAYLAAEIFFLPEGRARWIVVLLLGLAHGLPFAGFPQLYMAGAGAVQATGILALAFPALRLPPARRRTAALVLMAASAGWFTAVLMN
jgi:hypothetical protein